MAEAAFIVTSSEARIGMMDREGAGGSKLLCNRNIHLTIVLIES